MAVTKKCYKCGKDKPLQDFHRHRGKSYGVSNCCKECAINYQKEYRIKNREAIKERQHLYYTKNKDHIREKNDKWDSDHAEQMRAYHKKWKEDNREHCNEVMREWHNKKIKEDCVYAAAKRARCLIWQSLAKKGYQKNTKTYEMLGCDFDSLWSHLLGTWRKNYGRDWSGEPYAIDHIIPLAVATSEEEVKALCHYSNLQMLSPKDNRKKWYII